MAGSINGIGTTYYGQCDFDRDGSFITTKWVIMAFVPIVPTSSIRVQFADSGFFSGTTYDVIEEVPLHGVQVMKTWAYVIGMIALAGTVLDNKHINPIVQAVLLGVAAALPLTLRYFARNAAANPLPERVTRMERSERSERPVTPIPAGVKITTCPKCSYQRKPDDYAPDWQCPSCKVAYNKVMPAQSNQGR